MKFNGGCLKQTRPTLFHRGIVNVYIYNEIADNFNVSSYPTLFRAYLFGAVNIKQTLKISILVVSKYKTNKILLKS